MNKKNSMEKITAQNSTNQCEKIMGVFTTQNLSHMVKSSKPNWKHYDAQILTDYLRRCDSIISKLRASDETKSFLKSGYALLAKNIYKNERREYYGEWIPQNYWPSDIADMNPEDAAVSLEEELGFILNDISEMIEDNEGGFYNYDIKNFLKHFQEYLDEMPEGTEKYFSEYGTKVIKELSNITV